MAEIIPIDQSEKVREAIETLLFNGYELYHNGFKCVPTSGNCRTWSWMKKD
jgi:hypothetical protein